MKYKYKQKSMIRITQKTYTGNQFKTDSIKMKSLWNQESPVPESRRCRDLYNLPEICESMATF